MSGLRLLAVAILGLTLAAPAAKAATHHIPPQCRKDGHGRINYRACAEASPPGSPEHVLSLANLGARAFVKGDYQTAVRFYDEAQPPGGKRKVYSDVVFHAYRAAAYDHVGRDAEALENARIALAIMTGERLPGMPAEVAQTRYDPGLIYSLILPILRKGADEKFAAALAAYKALPATDWISLANRAGLLDKLDDHEGAVADIVQALQLKPDHPALLNNACYILANAGKVEEATPYCERAVRAAPQVAAVHDSYATALADAGRCDAAQAQLEAARKLDPSSKTYKRTLGCTPKS